MILALVALGVIAGGTAAVGAWLFARGTGLPSLFASLGLMALSGFTLGIAAGLTRACGGL